MGPYLWAIFQDRKDLCQRSQSLLRLTLLVLVLVLKYRKKNEIKIKISQSKRRKITWNRDIMKQGAVGKNHQTPNRREARFYSQPGQT